MASQDRRDPDFNQMENENSEQQIAWVCNILQKEAEKPDDQKDFQLIQECSDYLKELLEEINSIPANRIPAILKIRVRKPLSKQRKRFGLSLF